MKNSEPLKPCPFCGSAESEFEDHSKKCFLYMLKKQIETDCMAYCKEDMWIAWNTRTPEQRKRDDDE